MKQVTRQEVSNAQLVYLLLIATHFSIFTVCGFGPVAFGLLILLIVWAFDSSKRLRQAHALQGLLLVLMEGGFLAYVFFSSLNDFGWLLAFGIAALAIGASIGGIIQAGKGQTWMTGLNVEILPAPARETTPVTLPPAPNRVEKESVSSLLNAFRSADPAARDFAIRKLEALGEVETF